MKGKFRLDNRFKSLDAGALCISEITVAELKFGVANSAYPQKNSLVLEQFLKGIQIIPIFDALDIYATQKTRLRQNGLIVDDFDLLIGATSVAHNMTLVTNNTKHFANIQSINIENWTL